ncbi:glycoside hydrolase family 57 protein [Halorhodospira halophila]
MHQPSYLDPGTGDYLLPWTYLHGIKDYADMAAHLEANPAARAVVNFSPVLLEQLEDYSRQIAGFLESGERLRDPLLRALAMPTLPVNNPERRQLVEQCQRINRQRLADPFPAFRHLLEIAETVSAHPASMRYLSDAFLVDLITWYHLGWMGETVRRSEPRVQRLIDKGDGFTLHDRRELLGVIGELLAGLPHRYRHLAETGRVELSMTPYAHPILPLLQDLQSARESWPASPMPVVDQYPGGEERARWHLARGLEIFEHTFGHRPHGCWPSEGAVSQATLALLQSYGFRWTASGGAVLDNSLGAEGGGNGQWHRAYTLAPQHPEAEGHAATRCFFRDDGLSDAIGFEFSDWHGDDAVANLVSRMEAIAAGCEAPEQTVISVIMDGENAWEHYPANGFHFLNGLYQRLAEHPGLILTTFAEAADETEPRDLQRLVAGSWVYGTLSTWIGEVDKDRAWELLAEAKQAFDQRAGELDEATRIRAEAQLAICESSDWFWWFGDYNPAEVIRDFDHLYRVQLAALYHTLGQEPPEHLSHAFARQGRGQPERGGVMRHGRAEP